jgi:F-type H+-transporting ATPase subunit b
MKFGRPAARKLAAERHDQIKTALDEAAKLRKEAADKLDEYEKRLKAADDEIKKLVDGMKADAEADKKRILAAAETQAAQLKREAEQRIAAEILYARAQLTRDVTAAATAAAERILRDKLQPADQQALVSKFVASLEAAQKDSHGQR